MTLICGIDEAGRGPLCGPVFASAVILDSAIVFNGLKDSKKLSENNRNLLYKEIKDKAIEYSFATASVEEIDNLNILQASLLAMERAFSLLKKRTNFIYIDGIYCPYIKQPMQAVIKGDSLISAISAASIVAKVERDKYMKKLDEKYPQYNLKKHKGYPTKEHLALLNQYGVNEIYRRTFKPVQKLINKKNT
jgi:ribonuclease HII